MCVEELGRHTKYRMSSDLKISVLFVCRGGYVSCWNMQMITDIQKCKNDNLFSDQVLFLLMFTNRRECEVVTKIVFLVICILTYIDVAIEKANSRRV